jgi:hypothetical protein
MIEKEIKKNKHNFKENLRKHYISWSSISYVKMIVIHCKVTTMIRFFYIAPRLPTSKFQLRYAPVRFANPFFRLNNTQDGTLRARPPIIAASLLLPA